jgi:hypothetical protein
MYVQFGKIIKANRSFKTAELRFCFYFYFKNDSCVTLRLPRRCNYVTGCCILILSKHTIRTILDCQYFAFWFIQKLKKKKKKTLINYVKKVKAESINYFIFFARFSSNKINALTSFILFSI